MPAAPESKESELSFGEKLNQFIQRNRKPLFIGLVTLVVIIVGLIAGVTIRDNIQTRALTQIDEFTRRYERLRISDAAEDPNLITKLIEIVSLSDEISAFAAKNSGFAAARAYTLLADIHWDQNNFSAAENAWLEAARIASRNYLAPVSFYNAAVAAEERGNIDTAIAHYTRALGYGNMFPSAARAQFSVGRLEESRNNTEAALAAYRNLLNTWPNDPIWPNLAQSRILILSN
jgi:tetratricopeptide (TPR) repeat protein